MITRTLDGYVLNNLEGRPILLPTGMKITGGEIRAALCRKSGLSQREAAALLHCSTSNIKQYWQSIYYKLHTSDVVLALDKLSELGALIKICIAAFLIIGIGTGQDDLARRMRSRRSRDFASLEEAADLNKYLDHEISLVTKWVDSFDKVDA